jgi:hypothetical protein
LKTIIIVLDEYCFYYEHDAFKDNVTELAELKPNADNLVNLDCDGDEKSSLRLPIITT